MLVGQSPEGFEANHKLAEMYVRQGKLAAAIPYFEKARAADPNNDLNGDDLALAYLKTGGVQRARLQLNTMILREDRAGCRISWAPSRKRRGKIELAATEYQRAAQMEPSEKHVFLFRKLSAFPATTPPRRPGRFSSMAPASTLKPPGCGWDSAPASMP